MVFQEYIQFDSPINLRLFDQTAFINSNMVDKNLVIIFLSLFRTSTYFIGQQCNPEFKYFELFPIEIWSALHFLVHRERRERGCLFFQKKSR
jgi:hypothetical protein